MKKKILSLIIPALSICACSGGEKETKTVNIVAPTGAPAVAFYNHAEDDNFLAVSPATVKSQLTSKSPYTVVVVDTLSGVDALTNGAPFKIAATITFGNFFLASTGNDENSHLDVGDKIVVFNRGAVSDKVFHYIYGNDHDDNIVWVKDATEAKGCLETGKTTAGESVDYVFIAQPALFAAKQSNPNAAVYDNIQTKYEEKTGGKRLIQASVFIKNNLNREAAEEFLTTLKGDIEAGLETPNLISAGISKAGGQQEMIQRFGVAAGAAMNVTAQGNGMGLGFAYAKDIKEEIDNSLTTVYEHSVTTEEMYF